MSRATADVEAVRMVIGPGIMQLGNTVCTFAVAVAMMLSLSPALTLWSLLPLPLIAAVMYLSAQSYHRLHLAVQVQQAALNTVAQENFSGIRVVKAYGLEPRQREAFRAANEAYLRARHGPGARPRLLPPARRDGRRARDPDRALGRRARDHRRRDHPGHAGRLHGALRPA